MALNSRKILKNTLILYVRQIFVLAIGLFTTRLTLQVLGVSDFGVYAAVAGFTTLLSLITNTLSNGAQRFLTYELGRGDKEQLNKVYITSINIQILISIILLLIGETFGTWFVFNQMTLPTERLMTAFCVFQIALLNSIVSLVNSPNGAVIIAHEEMQIIAIATMLESILRLVSVIALFLRSWDKLIIYALALFGIQCLKRLIFIRYCRLHYEETKYKFIWDRELFKSMLHISGWIGLSSLAVTGFIQGINILLNIFFGPIVNAAYSVSMQAYSGVRAFCSNFQIASNPQIVKLYSSGDLLNMQRLLYRVCKMSFFLVFTLSLPFVINAEYVIEIWLGKVPEHSASFLILLFIYAYIDVFAYPLDVAAQATGNVRNYSVFLSIGVLGTLPIAYVAYSLGAVPESIYYIAIVLSWCCLFIRLIFLKQLIRIKPIDFCKEVLVRIIITALLAAIVPLMCLILLDSNIMSVVFSFFITYLTAVPIVMRIGLDREERQFVVARIASIKQKYYGQTNHIS